MKNKIHVWELRGLVYLHHNFIEIYKKNLKKYGICKLADELCVDYNTIASVYSRNKPINIKLLEKICKKFDINKNYAEKSVAAFTQNLKTKYNVKFPIEITPLSLRAVSMIIGDGTTSSTFSTWSQHYKNIHYGVKLIKQVIGYKPPIRNSSSTENCKIISIPKFLVNIISDMLDCKNIKSYEFFEKVCKLPRERQFQVFAQIVVDEGSPDRSFIIAQSNGCIKMGMAKLFNSLGYQYSKTKNGFYVNTESFTQIKKDLDNAKQEFGYLGGFWFKDKRFEKACTIVNPKFSRASRLYNEEFNKILEKVKNKDTFTYSEMKKLFKGDTRRLRLRIKNSVENKIIIKLNRGLYTFPEKLKNIDTEWLRKSKEEKVFTAIYELESATYKGIQRFTKLSESQMWRAINNLLKDKKIARTEENKYRIDKVSD